MRQVCRGRLRPAIVAALPVALVLAGCASSGSAALPRTTPRPTAASNPIPAPPGLVTPGTLTIAADYHFAPQSYVDGNGQAAGFDIDLAGAIARALKLQLAVLNIDDPSIIHGLTPEDRRYDIGANQPAQVASASGLPVLTYFASGQALLVASANRRIKGTSGLCGARVGAAAGSAGEQALARLNDGACHDRMVEIVAAPDDVAAARDVASGTLDALLDDYPAAVLLGRTTAGTRVVPHHFLTAPVDYVFPPGGDAIRNAVAAALKRLQRDGTYGRILNRWGLVEGAIKAVP